MPQIIYKYDVLFGITNYPVMMILLILTEPINMPFIHTNTEILYILKTGECKMSFPVMKIC